MPIAYEVLGAQFHLDELKPEDEPRLESAMSMVNGWIGDQLRWTRATAWGETVDFDNESLDFVSTYPRRLVLPPEIAASPMSARGPLVGAFVEPAAEYGVACGGTPIDQNDHAQIVSLRFYSDVTRIFPERPHLSAYSVLRITVPSDTPLKDFEAKVRELTDLLPVRWGTAGLMLSGAEREHWKAWKQVSFAYCMRHWGVDVGEYVTLTEAFYDWVRSVNWLTFLGPTMLRDLERMGSVPAATHDLTIDALPGGTCVLKAGPAPQRGDLNRLDIPRAYAAADKIVRPRRCDGFDDAGEPITFFEAWSEDRTRDWLRRFETGQ